MKSLVYVLGLLIAMLITNFSLGNENDSTKVIKKITKTIEINDDGKTVIDTVIYEFEEIDELLDLNIKHFHNQMNSNGHHSMKKMWVDNDEHEYDITIETIGDSSKVVVMKCPGTTKKKFILKTDEHDDNQVFMYNNEVFPYTHKEHKIKKINKTNLIDLNDPAIISFEKKETKDGNEKITIIRKK